MEILIMKYLVKIKLQSSTNWSKPYRSAIKLLSLSILIFVYSNCALAQIGIQTDTPDGSSVLDIVSSDKGLLIPRVSLTSNLSSSSPVTSPATGLLIYNSGSSQEHGFYFWTGTNWKMLKPQESGEVQGPSSSTDNAIARFDGTSGNIIQNSSVILDDAGNITGVNNITTAGFTMTTGAGENKVLISDASGNGSWSEALPLDVQEDDVLIASGINTMNFEGAVTVVDEGNNKATITVSASTAVEEFIQLSSNNSLDLNNLVTPIVIPWDVELFKDIAAFSHSNTTNSSRIIVLHDGLYEINYMFSVENIDNQRKTLRSRLKKNGTTFIDGSASYSFTYSKFDDMSTHVSSSFLVELNTNDYIEVFVNGQTNSGPVNLIPNENLIFVRIMRTW
ncbi:MAG: hypothetical protein QM503_04080 [Bacteroidota bacterium]